jgi:hypothetical protein
MTRTLMLVLVLWTSGGTAVAQYRGPRSADYLFGTSARGSRASWVNPAALGTTAEASIMIEGFVQRDAVGDYPLAQYTIGFSSRGFAFGYRRDRFRNADGGNTWRVAIGRGIGRLAVGAGFSMYGRSQQALDLGLRYQLASTLGLALKVDNILQPQVRDSSLRFGGTAGIGWTPFRSIGVDVETRGSDERGSGGVLLASRVGLRIGIPTRLPLLLTGVLDLDDGFSPTRLLVGLSLGGDYQLSAVADGSRLPSGDVFSGVSVLGEARKRLR